MKKPTQYTIHLDQKALRDAERRDDIACLFWAVAMTGVSFLTLALILYHI